MDSFAQIERESKATEASTVRRSRPAITDAAISGGRVTSVDALRGLVMGLMALDHVRDFFGAPGVSPTDLARTSLPLFLTRWVTHICAPVFFLLTGTGAFLSLGRKSVPEVSRFLFIRGVWLILLEVTVIRCLGFQFNFDYQVTMLLVLWALGWAMITLAALVWLPAPFVLAFGVVMMTGHNLLDDVRSAHPLWVIVHSPGFVVNRPGLVVFAPYTLVPWVGVTAAGYALGQVYRWSPERRRAFLLRLGLGLTAAFVALRATNVYGDPVPWTPQASSAAVLFPPAPAPDSRVSCRRVLRAERGRPLDVRIAKPRVVSVHPATWLGLVPSNDLLLWALVAGILYPVCRWFAMIKQRRTDTWLSYF